MVASVTRTLDNSNLSLTRSNFCFPSDHLLILNNFTLVCTEVRNIELILKQPCESLSLAFCHSTSNLVSISVYIIKVSAAPAFDSDKAPFYEIRKNIVSTVTLDIFPKAPHGEIA